MMEALSQTWNNSRKVAKCWEFDMVQNAFCCFTFFFREREAGLLLILYLSCTRCSWYVVDSSLLISSKRQGTNLKRAKRGGLEYIKLKFTCTYIQSAHGFALWLKLFKSKKKMYSSHLNIAYIPSIPSLRFLSQLKRLTSLRLLSATNVRDEIEFLWSTFTWVEQFNIWII